VAESLDHLWASIDQVPPADSTPQTGCNRLSTPSIAEWEAVQSISCALDVGAARRLGGAPRDASDDHEPVSDAEVEPVEKNVMDAGGQSADVVELVARRNPACHAARIAGLSGTPAYDEERPCHHSDPPRHSSDPTSPSLAYSAPSSTAAGIAAPPSNSYPCH